MKALAPLRGADGVEGLGAIAPGLNLFIWPGTGQGRSGRTSTWFGSDGSGLIKSARMRWSFFTEEQRTRWETAKPPEAREDLSPALDLFAPGCLHGHRAMLSKLPTDPAELAADLGDRSSMGDASS